MEKAILARVNRLVQYVALLFLLLTTGVFWGVWLSVSRSYHVFTIDEFRRVAGVLIGNLSTSMAFISAACVVCMLAAAWLFPAKKSVAFYCLLSSIGLVGLALGITLAVEAPINQQIISWTATTVPADWEAIRNRWQAFNLIRTGAALVSFGLFAAALLSPAATAHQ